jgi:hypothetical protein
MAIAQYEGWSRLERLDGANVLCELAKHFFRKVDWNVRGDRRPIAQLMC